MARTKKEAVKARPAAKAAPKKSAAKKSAPKKIAAKPPSKKSAVKAKLSPKATGKVAAKKKTSGGKAPRGEEVAPEEGRVQGQGRGRYHRRHGEDRDHEGTGQKVDRRREVGETGNRLHAAADAPRRSRPRFGRRCERADRGWLVHPRHGRRTTAPWSRGGRGPRRAQ